MAIDAENEKEFAEWIKSWFVDAIEYEKIKIIAPKNTTPYINVFDAILSYAIASVSDYEWREIARHYWYKDWSQVDWSKV